MFYDNLSGWLERKATRNYLIHQQYYIKMRPEARGVWAKDLIPNFSIIGNCRLGNGQGHHSLEGPGDCWLYGDPSQSATVLFEEHL